MKNRNCLQFVFLFSVAFFLILNPSFAQTEIKKKLQLETHFLKVAETYYPFPQPGKMIKAVVFTTKLTNVSKDTISFLTMNCSHEMLFTVTPYANYEIIPSFNCTANYPIIIKLAPSETYEREIRVRCLKKGSGVIKDLKICFNYVLHEEEQGLTPETYIEYSKVIWNLIDHCHELGIQIWTSTSY
jgi:hypothetical protein